MWWKLTSLERSFIKSIEEDLDEDFFDLTTDIKILIDEEDLSAYSKKDQGKE
jgi:hypothetical protein